MVRPRSRVSKVRVVGPLAGSVDGFTAMLVDEGYTPLSVVNQLRLLAHLSRWMLDRGIESTDCVSAEVVGECLAAGPGRAPDGSRSHVSGTALLRWLGVPTPAPAPESGQSAAVSRLLDGFERYLLRERGLAGCTTSAYVARAGRFLAVAAPDGRVSGVTAADVTAAVLRESDRVSVGSTQYYVAAVRSFLRYCFAEGLLPIDLSGAALAVTGRRRSTLPRGIDPGDAKRLLRACDRRTAAGRRDYAVILVLLRLGLRAGEAAGLLLEDLDWRAGEVVVRGKGRREERLPLPVDVGEAIVGYLRRGRPATASRAVFVRLNAPTGPLARGGVSSIVRHASVRAGLPPMGAHRLRHTLACQMVAAGVGLPAIGQVLRHRGLVSTATYARVDVDALRALAQPWPVSQP